MAVQSSNKRDSDCISYVVPGSSVFNENKKQYVLATLGP